MVTKRRETRWVYSTPASALEAEGQVCVLCGGVIKRDRHPCLWLKKVFQNGRAWMRRQPSEAARSQRSRKVFMGFSVGLTGRVETGARDVSASPWAPVG